MAGTSFPIKASVCAKATIVLRCGHSIRMMLLNLQNLRQKQRKGKGTGLRGYLQCLMCNITLPNRAD